MASKQCTACKGELEIGFIPDAGDHLVNLVMGWHKGGPEDAKMFGMKTGSVTSSSPKKPIEAWRCRDCGLLHLFAK